MKEVFAGDVYFLGYLSDSAVYNYLLDTSYFVAFFEQGVRANNTSVNAAMDCGAVVVTNLDAWSPRAYVHMDNVIDIDRCDALPTERALLEAIGSRARTTAATLGWDALTDLMLR